MEQDFFESHLQRLHWSDEPKGLYQPISYTLEGGGKRIRPKLVLMANTLFGGEAEAALPAALAIEIFHNFTLLHDDVMDHARVRRGRPTVHCKWDVNTAILSGDAMMIKAYEYLNRLPNELLIKVLPVFTATALEVCEGQQYDMNFEQMADVSIGAYFEMIRLKTAVLLAAALKMGALVGGSSDADAQALYDFGIALGIAFQLRDDFLDTFGDEKTFGKRIGGDILCGKKTFLLITALDCADADTQAYIRKTLSDKQLLDDEKIAAMQAVYRRLGVPQACNDAVARYYEQALRQLDLVAGNRTSKQPFVDLAAKLMGREA